MRFQSLRYDEPGLQEDRQGGRLGFPQMRMKSLIYNKTNIVSAGCEDGPPIRNGPDLSEWVSLRQVFMARR